MLRREWLLGHTLPGGQWQLGSTRVHPGTCAGLYPYQWPGGDDGEHSQQVCNDTRPGVICWYTPRLGLLFQGTWMAWRKGTLKFSNNKRKVLPQERRDPGDSTGWEQAGSAEKGASTCFTQNIYIQEQIRNCILTVKSFSEHKIEKSLWRKKMHLYMFILSLLNFMAISPRYVWQIIYWVFALDLTFLGLK